MDGNQERSKPSYWSRRRLLRTGVVGAAGLGAAALIGCSSGSKSGAPAADKAPAGASGAAAGQPKRGGTIKAVYNYDVPTLDIHNAVTAGQGITVMGSVYSGLTRYSWKEPWKADADLAESWTTPDPQQWVFKLRPGIKYHDGSEFSAKDVVYNLKAMTSAEGAKLDAAIGGLLARIGVTAEAPDANTVVIKTKDPAPYLANILAKSGAKFMKPDVIERKAFDKEFIGTGPWKLDRFERGTGFFYSKNPNFYIPGLPYADKLTRTLITDVPPELSAMATLQVHTIGSFPALLPSQIATITKQAGDKVVVSEIANGTSRVFVATDRKPFNDKRVRMAAHMAIDRADVVKRSYEGALVPGILDARDSGEYALSKDELNALPGFRSPKDKDMTEIKALLSAAGYSGDGPAPVLIARRTSLYVEAMTVVADNLAKAGFKPNFQAVESSLGITRQIQGDYDMGTVLPAPNADPILTLVDLLATGANHTAPKEDDWVKNVQDRLQTALKNSNKAERIEAAKAVQKYVSSVDSGVFSLGGYTGFVVNAKVLKDNFAAPTTSGEAFYDAWLDQ